MRDVADLYERAYGRRVEPFPYQRSLADRFDTDILIAPTGLGKTAAVTLAWAWRRLQAEESTPRRLLWCLPMRTLVEQTVRQANEWMSALQGEFLHAGQPTPKVHTIMGGAVDDDWRLRPEDAAILVGTQDMLLSRALMRGYGMSRFGWPIDFGLLHTDTQWVFDEVQLMGSALATSAQLEGFRRARAWATENMARSLWVSATLDPSWLQTAEFWAEVPIPRVLRWNDGNPHEPAALAACIDAEKRLTSATTVLTDADAKKPDGYARQLAREVAAAHRPGTTTLVIVNTATRAQSVYTALNKFTPLETEKFLIHSRFRFDDRKLLEQRILSTQHISRIIVATQAVEAGIDLTSSVLFTELAPWSSLVQRFGRCNRRGECSGEGGADVRWIDLELGDSSASIRPYEQNALAHARDLLQNLSEVSPRNLPPPSPPPTPRQVIRPKDFLELFDTEADLSGYDIDISPYIREGQELTVRVFWRDVTDADRVSASGPRREELCAAPVTMAQDWLAPKGAAARAYIEDPLAKEPNQWARLRPGQRLRPGITILLDSSVGGYDSERGFLGLGSKVPVSPVVPPHPSASGFVETDADEGASAGSDIMSFNFRAPLALDVHLADVASIARQIAESVSLPHAYAAALFRAGAWHDLGKAYAPFQERLGRSADGPLLAKSTNVETPKVTKQGQAAGLRRYFRHELASAIAFLAQHDGEIDADLVGFLVAAHHGKVRMAIRALPPERANGKQRLARGVQDGDHLPEVTCGKEISRAQTLDLGLMAMGEDLDRRRSWSERTQELLRDHGPFRLGYLEALLRMADWRASAMREENQVANV